MLSGVASALFIALRIQAGLAANISPSSTNRIPTPMRKSVNAMDLIGLEPPLCYRVGGTFVPAVLLRLRLRRGRARRIPELAEETRIGLQPQPASPPLQPLPL